MNDPRYNAVQTIRCDYTECGLMPDHDGPHKRALDVRAALFEDAHEPWCTPALMCTGNPNLCGGPSGRHGLKRLTRPCVECIEDTPQSGPAYERTPLRSAIEAIRDDLCECDHAGCVESAWRETLTAALDGSL